MRKQFWRCLGIFPLIFSFHLFWRKFCAGCSLSQAQISPFIQAFADPTLFANDPMVQTRFEYSSLYPRFMALILNLVQDYDAAIFSVHLVAMITAFTFFFLLCRRVFKSDKDALLATAALPLSYPMFHGYMNLWNSIFFVPTANSVAFAFGCAAFYFLHKGEKIKSSFILALGTYIHPLIMFHLFAIILGAEFFQGLRTFTTFIKTSWKWILTYFLVAGPYLASDALRGRSYSPEDLVTFLQINTRDSFVLNWSPDVFIHYFSFLSLLFYCRRWGAGKSRPEESNWCVPLIFSSLFLCGLATIGAGFFKLPTAIILQLNRSSIWICAICIFLIIPTLRQEWRKSWISKVACVLILLPFFDRTFYALKITPYISSALVVLLLLEKRSRQTLLFGALQLVLIAKWALFAKEKTEFISWVYYVTIFPVATWTWAVASFILFWIAIAAWDRRSEYLRSVVILVIGLGLFANAYISRFDNALAVDRAWREIQDWSRVNSKKEDIFISPFYQLGFRVYSQRSTLIEKQDGTQQYFSVGFGKIYRERLTDIGFNPLKSLERQVAAERKTLTKDNLLMLSSKYKARYYIFFKNNPLTRTEIFDDTQLPVAYENQFFKVVSLSDSK